MRKAILMAVATAVLMVQPVMANYDYDEELWCLSGIIELEAGNCSRDIKEGVANVAANRVADPDFPDTYHDVVLQPGQYSTAAQINSVERSQESIDVAKETIENGSKFPPDIVFQANFPQGSYTYMTLSTSFSTMYFCGK